MTKNKKKLRRAERRYSVSRTAQTLVLTGLLVASGVGTALAASATVETKAEWNAAVTAGIPATDFLIVQKHTTDADVAITTDTAGTILGGLKIDSGTTHNSSLTLGANFGVGTSVLIQGNTTTKTGKLDTGAFTFTAGGATTIGDAGTLTVSNGGTYKAGGTITVGGANSSTLAVLGTVQGNVATTAAKSDINLTGIIAGNVTLNGDAAADSKLTSNADTATVTGNVIVNKGTISTAAGNLTIGGTLELKDANAVFTPTAGKTLEVGTLKLGTNVAVGAGTLNITSGLETTETTSLTLNTGGIIHYKGVDARLDSWTSGLLLGTGGTLTVDKTLVMDGFNIMATKGTADTSSTTITAAALKLDRKGTLGATDKGSHTMTINATADTAFLSGGDLTLVGAANNVTTLNLKGVSNSTNSIILSGVDDGGASLTVGTNGQASPTTISMGTLNVGGATTHGAVSIAGTANNLSTLSVTGLNIGANGKVDIAANGVLNINNNFQIADDKIGANSVAGGIQVAANSALHVRGTLTLTPNAGAGDVSAGVAATGTVVADVVKAGITGTEKLTWTGGSLTLLGDGAGKFLQASELEITGNGVNFGSSVGGHAIMGGTFANKVTLGSAGKLHVNKGEWTLSGTGANGLTVSANGVVEVLGGTLNVAQWTSTTAGAADVKGGTLNLTGTTVGSVVTGVGDIKASAGGAVTAERSAVITDDFTNKALGVNTFNITDTGVLTIKNATKSMTLGEYGTLKTALMTGTGTLRLDGVTFSDVTDKTTITEVNGVSVADKVVNVVTGNSVTSFGTEVKGLKGDGTADIALGITGGLTIVGGNNTDFNLSANGDKNTNITVSAANAQLNLGSAAGPATGGTLLGNVTLSNAAANLNATNGTFTVGDVIATANNDGIVTADRASLSAKSLGTSTESLAAINTIKGGVVKTAGDAFVTTVNLENGGLQAKDMTVATANVGTGTLLATNNLTLTTANLKGGTAQATKNLTVTTANVDGGKLLAGNDLTITTFNNGTANAVNDATIAANNKLTLTNVMNATKVSINAKELAAAAAITAANSNINVGKMTLAAAVTLTEGTNMTVGDFTGSAQTVTVGATTDKIGSSLTINKLTSGAAATTFFVDPLADNSIVHVKSVDAAGTIDKFIAANNGIVSFGEHGMDWAKTQMAESGMAPTATLVLATPVKLDGVGQVLVGKDFDSTGKWQNTGVASTNALDVRGNSLIIADVTNLGSKAALSIGTTTNKTANIDSTAGVRLYSNTLKGDQSYTLVDGIASASGMTQDGTAVTSGSSLKLASLSTSNLLLGLGNVVYTAGAADTGTLKTSTFVRNASDVLPKISTSMGSYLENMARTTGFDTASGNTGVRFVSRALDSRFIGTNDPTRAAATIEGAAQLAAVGATPGMTISASTAATTASNTRTSFATPLMDNTKAVALHQGTDGTISLDSGLSAGSSMKTGLGVWIMPLYQSNNVWGMEAENFKSGYKSDLGGVVLGADYTIDDSLRFGLAFSLGGGYAQSTGDFNATDNSFNFWGLNLYGGWSQNNFGISGDVGYTSTYNKVKQETPTALQMGDIKSDVTSRAWTAGLRGEYKFATEVLDIIPHVGVRYLGLTSDSYKAKIGGETVFKADEAYQSIWTFPVGVTFAKEITNDSGWTFRPQVDLGITPATGDVKAKSRVRIPNVDGSAEMKMQVMDYMSYDGGIGLEMKKDNVSFGVNYNIQASEHRTGHGVFGTLRYEF